MSDIDAILKRAFAEAPEPTDDGFSLRVTHAVARRERFNKLIGMVHAAGTVAVGAGLLAGAVALYGSFGQDLLATGGIEVARAYGALSGEAPAVTGQAQTWLQALTAGLMSQSLIIFALLAGGAVAYRSIND